MHTKRSLLLVVCVGLASPAPAPGQAAPPDANYWIYVANESSDLVSRVRFGPDGIEEEKTISVGWHPADLDGAHGLFVAPTSNHWYLSLARRFVLSRGASLAGR